MYVDLVFEYSVQAFGDDRLLLLLLYLAFSHVRTFFRFNYCYRWTEVDTVLGYRWTGVDTVLGYRELKYIQF